MGEITDEAKQQAHHPRGLAFLSICCLLQMYDSIVPLILTNTFH